MLRSDALDSLAKQLAGVVGTLSALAEGPMGRPELVRKESEDVERLFQGVAKAKPSTEAAYAAALAFMRGHRLDERQLDLVAFALSERIREHGGGRPVGHPTFAALLETYGREADAGHLWRLTWFGLLVSYFAFDPAKATEAENLGWGRLRAFLERSWPLIERQSDSSVVPDWVKVLRADPDVLGEKAAHRHALDYLRGDDMGVKRLSLGLGIPESSWFWQALVLDAVRRGAEQRDEQFKASIPQLLKLVEARPVYRDDAVEILLTRYHRCAQPVLHQQLRDYVTRKDVWRNPKLRDAGLATAWTRVTDDVWRMVLQWVNEANLKDFFEILAARGGSDEGRLAFWSRYLEQITWTRLIFSSQTRHLARSNSGIRNLIAREEGAYATMSSNADVDAFMMQLGDYIVVEFSRVPNAAYVYKADELPFEPYARQYAGTKSDLKHGFDGERAARFTHQPGWERDAHLALSRLGIHPDVNTHRARGGTSGARRVPADEEVFRTPTSSNTRDSAPRGAKFTMESLRHLVATFPGAQVDDRRNASGGRLWVLDQRQHGKLATKLEELGFRWARGPSAYYFPAET